MMSRSAPTACASARPVSTARSGLGDIRHLINDNTKTESFEFLRQHRAPLQSQKSSLTLTAGLGFQQRHGKRFLRPRLSRPHPHREPYLRLQASGRFSRHQLSDDRPSAGARHPRRSHRDDDLLSHDGASGKFTALKLLVHALPDADGFVLALDRRRRPMGVRSALYLATILSRRHRVRPWLRQRRDQRRQRHRRLARTALRPEGQLSILERLPALQLR